MKACGGRTLHLLSILHAYGQVQTTTDPGVLLVSLLSIPEPQRIVYYPAPVHYLLRVETGEEDGEKWSNAVVVAVHSKDVTDDAGSFVWHISSSSAHGV